MSHTQTPNSEDARTIRNESPLPEFEAPPKDHRFWAVILATCVALFLSALDLVRHQNFFFQVQTIDRISIQTALSTALPTIVRDLKSTQFTWVGSAYALTSTAFIPWMGGLSYIFGRRELMLTSLAFFAIGSAICGAAPTMTVLLIGRSIQGIGGGEFSLGR
jgi:MFS family permease